MGQARIEYLSEHNETDYFALAAEYLPDSDRGKMKQRAGLYPKAFVALAAEGELAGVAFGWPRELDVPGEKSFSLDGIAVREPYQRNGYGRLLLDAFLSAVKEYGYSVVSVGSAGGYVETFYIANGFIPTEYKIYAEGGIKAVHRYADLEDYRVYERPREDGFVVLERHF